MTKPHSFYFIVLHPFIWVFSLGLTSSASVFPLWRKFYDPIEKAVFFLHSEGLTHGLTGGGGSTEKIMDKKVLLWLQEHLACTKGSTSFSALTHPLCQGLSTQTGPRHSLNTWKTRVHETSRIMALYPAAPIALRHLGVRRTGSLMPPSFSSQPVEKIIKDNWWIILMNPQRGSGFFLKPQKQEHLPFIAGFVELLVALFCFPFLFFRTCKRNNTNYGNKIQKIKLSFSYVSGSTIHCIVVVCHCIIGIFYLQE